MMAATGEVDLGRGVYSPRVAARVARIRYQNFQAWAKAHLLRPSTFWAGRAAESTYTYQDLLLIRLIVRLKAEGATPKSIRAALSMIELVSGTKDAWARAVMAVHDGAVLAWLPDTPDWNPLAAKGGPQKGLHIVFFPRLIKELEDELVPAERFPYVEVNPGVLGGMPVIKGTRISTRAVVAIRESGTDPKAAYPSLSDEQIANAEAYEAFLQAA